MRSYIIIAIALVILGGFFVVRSLNQFDIPDGETRLVEKRSMDTENEIPEALEELSEVIDEATEEEEEIVPEVTEEEISDTPKAATKTFARTSVRDIFETDGVRHSIPLNEILSGGPPKDGIPSIDDPKFISVSEAREFVEDSDVGLGVTLNGEARFYPYSVLVWHEIVNDTIAGDPVLVTYCPLCATGVVFDRRVAGEIQEFGVSGRLWQSNLLMYNRAANVDDESLWSQVLGEAVLGPNTGEVLDIIPSDTARFSEWISAHPNTVVLSRDTGALRAYGSDPYGDYYTNESVSFGATFNDDRLHPKQFVLGIEVNGRFKAYDEEAIPEGTTTDTFAGNTITIERDAFGNIEMFIGADRQPLSYIGGFWFSWLAVHEDTALWP